MKKRRLLAPFLMLLAGAIASVWMVIQRYELGSMLGILIPILVIFYISGFLVAKLLDRFDRQNEKNDIQEEGEVIEKDAEAAEDAPADSAGR